MSLQSLDELGTVAMALLEQLEPRARMRAMAELSREIRALNQARMKAQTGPDGAAWEKRRTRKPAPQPKSAIRFVYTNGKGVTRQAQMRSWVGRGSVITGFDQEAGAIRTFRQDRILVRDLPVQGGGGSGSEQAVRRRRLAPTAMFVKMRTAAHFKAGASPGEAWAQFASRAQRLAALHHNGGRDRVAKDGPEVDYPARPLVGWGDGDERVMLQRFVDRLTAGF